MYKTIIKMTDDIEDDALASLCDMAAKAFQNRAGQLANVSTRPREFVFEGDESGYGCLELGMIFLHKQKAFFDKVSTWLWIDEDPEESCDMLEVFAKPVA